LHALPHPTMHTSPPLVWGEDVKSAFTAYLETSSLGNYLDDRDWSLFQLYGTATQATLAPNFEDLLALEHIQGFIPLPHQIATARRVIQELHGRAILADEVGLGKTIEAGLIIKEYLLRGLVRKILILVPASLVLQWTRELREKFRVECHAQKNEWCWRQYDIVVASLDTAKREIHRTAILNEPWDMLIIDEAHKLKNSKTRNWQTVNQIPNKFMLLLTATPMQNNLKELHTLITLLRPGHLGSTQEFANEHVKSARTPKNPAQLKSNLSNVMIRNKRRDGGTNLPNRKVEVIELTLNESERCLYDAVQSFLRSEYRNCKELKMSVLPLLTLLREICSSPYAALITLEKMFKKSTDDKYRAMLGELITHANAVRGCTKVERVLDLVHTIGEKCIIFTEYRATQDYLLYMLKQQKITAVPFRGGFKRSKKDWMTDLFEKKVQVLVATESGGEGINLQFCHHMINFDLPWNPMRLEQRIGRVHRLGQTKEVEIINLATADTIEIHIVKLLYEKIRMFELVIGELDYILDEKNFHKFEENILDIALTSSSNDELAARVDMYGNELTITLENRG